MHQGSALSCNRFVFSVLCGRWSTPRWTGTSAARFSRYCTSSAAHWTIWCAKSSTTRSTAIRSRSTPHTIASYQARPTFCRATLPSPNLQMTRGQPPPPPIQRPLPPLLWTSCRLRRRPNPFSNTESAKTARNWTYL